MASQTVMDMGAAVTESKGTFKNIHRKSIIQTEYIPHATNKTVLPPNLSEKMAREYQKAQKFFRSETGKAIGQNT